MTETLPVAVPEVYPLGAYAASRCFGLDLVIEESPGAGTYVASVVVPTGTLVLTAFLFSAPWAADEALFSLQAGDVVWIPSVDLAGAGGDGPGVPQTLSGGFLPAEDTTLTAQVVASGAGGSSGVARVRLIYLPPATVGSEAAAVKTT